MTKKTIHVAVGVIEKDNTILIAKRQKGQHLEGFWEFPGGKVEAGESAEDALIRELQEEVNIKVTSSKFLFDIDYAYPEKNVKLSIYVVSHFTGEATGSEGQALQWCSINALQKYTFPPANQAIIDYLLA